MVEVLITFDQSNPFVTLFFPKWSEKIPENLSISKKVVCFENFEENEKNIRTI